MEQDMLREQALVQMVNEHQRETIRLSLGNLGLREKKLAAP